MATKRCLQTLARQSSIFSPNPSLQYLHRTLNPHLQTLTLTLASTPQTPKDDHIWHSLILSPNTHFAFARSFSSNRGNGTASDEDDGVSVSEDEDGEISDGEEVLAANGANRREYSVEEKETEAAAIGYKVIGQLERAERIFKDYEPVFAVIQIGSHQFKVSNGDCVYTERLKFCEVNDKLILNRVLMLGSKTQTMIGRPILPDAAVHAVVEEHALDAKVIIFKKKRRKNYRRTKGHRQELTKLRITDIQGIEKPEKTAPAKPEKSPPGKTEKASVKKVEKVTVAA
ncbi:hypothetical protein RJ639_010813 [Escallonia herrerae]|uniref:Large ribosomal subunit protein bL21m n=1 Tax=Escallonia herrerae TaxID=1293975 RepID=A0AA88VJR9_9ASTE|nr:hypothetical protein RJ639_010813 [Escallonia herrerae]